MAKHDQNCVGSSAKIGRFRADDLIIDHTNGACLFGT
jgi:hypothetical protein